MFIFSRDISYIAYDYETAEQIKKALYKFVNVRNELKKVCYNYVV